MEIWFDLQNVSVVSDLQNISPPGSDVNMEQKLRWEKGVTETQGHYWTFAYFTPKFSSRSVGELILSVK